MDEDEDVPCHRRAYAESDLPRTISGRPWAMTELTSGPFGGMGRRGGICRKRMSPIKRSYFFETEEVTLFKSRGWDTKKIAGEIRGCHENALAKSFEMSPHMI